ncbi:MAG: 50S ribosomal protein L25, partial [bacterium]
MKQLSLTVTNRQSLGRGHSRRLRVSGSIPAIIYGPAGTHSVAVEQDKFRDLMRAKGTAAALIELELDGKKMLSIIKEFQRHPITQKFLHIDIQQIDPNAPMTAAIPVRAVGEAYGVKTDGGTLAIVSQTINVRCLPKDLPEFIEIDVTALKVNESIHVGEVKAPAGITFPGDPNRVVIVCSEMAAEEAAPEPAVTSAAVPGA